MMYGPQAVFAGHLPLGRPFNRLVTVLFSMFSACAGLSMSDAPEIKIWLGQDASQLEQYLASPLLLDRSQILMIRNPHKAKINARKGYIEVLIDGSNSATLITTKITQIDSATFSEISSISTDSGHKLLDLKEASLLADRWCSIVADEKDDLLKTTKSNNSASKCLYKSAKVKELSGVEISESKSLDGDILGYRVLLSLNRY